MWCIFTGRIVTTSSDAFERDPPQPQRAPTHHAPALQNVPTAHSEPTPSRPSTSKGVLSTSVTSQYPRPVSGPMAQRSSSAHYVRQVPGSPAAIDNMATGSHAPLSSAPRIVHRGRTIVATRARAMTPRAVHVAGAAPGGMYRARAPVHIRHDPGKS